MALEDTTIKTIYGKGAKSYEHVMERYWHVERQPLVEQLQLQQGMKTLVATVGTGLDLPYFPRGVNVIGVDYTKEMLEEARLKKSLADIDLRIMDMHNLNFPDNYFDAVLSTFTFCVLRDPRKALDEILRVSKPNARVVICDYVCSRNPETRKWQELFQYHATNVGFPPNTICWDSLFNYDKLLSKDLLLDLEVNEQIENENPFLTCRHIVGKKKCKSKTM